MAWGEGVIAPAVADRYDDYVLVTPPVPATARGRRTGDALTRRRA
jgi:hypothetical protein